MKRTVFFLALFGVTAFAQDRTMRDTFQSPPTTREREIVSVAPIEKPNQIVTERRTYNGIVVQLIKTKNPLQLINPFAPKEYGSGEDNLVVERDPITGNHAGLKIVSVSMGH